MSDFLERVNSEEMCPGLQLPATGQTQISQEGLSALLPAEKLVPVCRADPELI